MTGALKPVIVHVHHRLLIFTYQPNNNLNKNETTFLILSSFSPTKEVGELVKTTQTLRHSSINNIQFNSNFKFIFYYDY